METYCTLHTYDKSNGEIEDRCSGVLHQHSCNEILSHQLKSILGRFENPEKALAFVKGWRPNREFELCDKCIA